MLIWAHAGVNAMHYACKCCPSVWKAAHCCLCRALALLAVLTAAGLPVVAQTPCLSRPGGNLSGVSDVAIELTPKRIQLLKETVPGLQPNVIFS